MYYAMNEIGLCSKAAIEENQAIEKQNIF